LERGQGVRYKKDYLDINPRNKLNIYMDLFLFILIIVGMAGIFYLLVRWEKRTKKDYKEKAANLLLTSDPDPREVKDTIKNLHLYSGRFRKDKEAVSLITELQDKHGHLIVK
jgi:hypothetical protein